MFFLLVHGRRARARPLGKRSAYCGACIAKTEQDVFELEQTAHLYFIEVWSSGRRVVARCAACGAFTPVVTRDAPAARAQRGAKRIDAFLDATAPDLVRAQKGNAATALGSVIGVAGFAALAGVAILLGDTQPSTGLGVGVFLVATVVTVALGVLVYRRLHPGVVARVFAPVVTPRLVRLLTATRRTVADVIERAHAIGYADLARALADVRYAAIAAPAEASPAGERDD